MCGSLYYKVAGLEANIAQSAYFCQHNIYIVFIRIVFLRYLQLSKTFSLLQEWRVSIWGVTSRTVIFSVGNLSNHIQSLHQSLHENYANNEFFLVRIFPHLDQKKLRIWTFFTQWYATKNNTFNKRSVIKNQTDTKVFISHHN